MRIGRAATLASVVTAGCWYGPPEDVVRIEHALRRHNSHAVAVAVTRVSQRPPRGLATFPNGGVSRVLGASVSLYFGDPARGWLRRASDFPVPEHVLHGVKAHVEGIDEEAAYLTISGCAQNECWGDLRAFERLKVSPDGTVERVDSVPKAARPGGESLARMQGETLYLRIGYDWNAVEASLDPDQAREIVFRLDPESGALRLSEPYPFPVPSASGVEPERQPGERIVSAPMAESPVRGGNCLEHPWRASPASGALSSTDCEVVDTGSLPRTGAVEWVWALYRREAVYEAPADVLDEDLDLYPDSVRETELILFAGEGGREMRPVWHDREEDAYYFLRPPRAAALEDETALMVHRRCLNGTGGCSDHPYRLTVRGAVEPLIPAYAEDLAGRLPEGWLTAKGIQLEPDAPRARAAVYLPADANCCPSFVADMRLRLVGDSLVADSIALEPEAGGVWRIEPGKTFGPIGPETSEAQVREQFGRTSTQRSEIHIGEGFCAPGLRVFPGTPWEIEVVWSDTTRARPAFVRTAAAGTELHTPAGVRVGSTLAELEQISGEPVEFSGFGWDYGGRVRWQEDSGEVLLQLAIDPASMPRLTELASTDRRVDEISGDRNVRSDHPIIRQIDVTVTGLELHWDRVWNSRDCE